MVLLWAAAPSAGRGRTLFFTHHDGRLISILQEMWATDSNKVQEFMFSYLKDPLREVEQPYFHLEEVPSLSAPTHLALTCPALTHPVLTHSGFQSAVLMLVIAAYSWVKNLTFP